MCAPRHSRTWRRLQAGFWTGPAGHLLGGTLDLVGAVSRYLLARARGRTVA